MGKYISVGDSAYDRRDDLVHLVSDVGPGADNISCVVACQQARMPAWCRVATDYLAKPPHGPLAPRWRVFEQVNCIACLAVMS